MKLLLLVQSEADVARLDGAAKAILSSAITGVWVVFSPAITVNTSEAAAKLEAEILQLRTAERQAADRGDYAAAAGYKTQREGKELDKGKALRDAWKLAPDEEKKARTKAIFSPFIEPLKKAGLNVRITGHSDHYEREQWVAMLNSLSGVWFKEFTPGSFLVGWPEAVETSVKMIQNTVPVRDPELPRVPTIAKEAVKQISRREELEALHPMKLGPLMRSLGLDPEGKTRAQKIDEILASNPGGSPVAAAPETADAY